ncbi:LacI family DNA-binding transcriptional regulator [Pseudovibrio exalbescens]|uniref:LacI family DNA-binding transcriptional regulator n=1 Tax=Pseudovibrio exalbescens TaxID=197461 RepID=UPI002366B73D|nr:LacI family DNA-binding transcriptional regulator [Pseudovibrio exalbescens]MDD7912055.1 LacI family DNA-binding transcriptional regulator [Pseudovibrio exalbescens]
MKRSQSSRITIADIAKQAGVSSATVSNVINETGRMTEETRFKVRKAMSELGFVKDYTAARLRTGRSKLIGVLIQNIANPFYGEFSATFEAELSKHGYLPIMANIGESLDRQAAMIEEVISHGVAGIALSPVAGSTPECMDTIVSRNLPFVTFVREIEGLNCDFFGADDRHGAHLAAQHLLSKGHRIFGVIGGTEGTTTGEQRLSGFEDTIHYANCADAQIHKLRTPPGRENGRLAAIELLSANPEITAIFCHNDILAMGATAGLKSLRRKVGKDIALVGFDNLPEAEVWNPPLTTIEMFPKTIGTEVARALLAQLERTHQGPLINRRPPVLIERESSAFQVGTNSSLQYIAKAG